MAHWPPEETTPNLGRYASSTGQPILRNLQYSNRQFCLPSNISPISQRADCGVGVIMRVYNLITQTKQINHAKKERRPPAYRASIPPNREGTSFLNDDIFNTPNYLMVQNR